MLFLVRNLLNFKWFDECHRYLVLIRYKCSRGVLCIYHSMYVYLCVCVFLFVLEVLLLIFKSIVSFCIEFHSQFRCFLLSFIWRFGRSNILSHGFENIEIEFRKKKKIKSSSIKCMQENKIHKKRFLLVFVVDSCWNGMYHGYKNPSLLPSFTLPLAIYFSLNRISNIEYNTQHLVKWISYFLATA